MRFENRLQAGVLLSDKLKKWSTSRPLVLALPRGGVPVAFEISKRLGGDLDLLFVKKIGVPGREELAVGAISEDGRPFWNEDVVGHSGVSPGDLQALARKKSLEVAGQAESLRGGRPKAGINGRVVILVDDGLATGATMIAALHVLKKQNPRKVIVAVPVASADTAATIRKMCDELVVGLIPPELWSIGLWYEDFTQVTDEEVRELLASPEGAVGEDCEVEIIDGSERLTGRMTLPPHARALIIFAHGSGSTHSSPRNLRVAKALQAEGFGTLLFDLLTEDEALDRSQVFNIDLLVERLLTATRFARGRLAGRSIPIGYFGASTGAAAALGAAARDPSIFAIVSRGGRPDLAMQDLPAVKAPSLLIVGGADHPVIPLNEKARARLPQAEIVIIPGATHLFEEPGALDRVVEYAGSWFARCLKETPPRRAPIPVEEVVAEIRSVARAVRSADDLDPLLRRMSGARVVMLGEATHGTEDFYELRRQISQKLIKDYGFNFIAVEGDWPDCYELNRYIAEPDFALSALEVMNRFTRWPTWMWANGQVEQLIEWMKGRGAGFYGLDVYSLYESLNVLKKYAAKVDPQLAQKIRSVYSCFEPYEHSEIQYASKLVRFPQHCETEVVECLRELARARIERTSLTRDEIFDARQNAMVLRNAERYYRAMLHGDAESWNIRDGHMMDTLDALLHRHGEGAKAIVWAHNTHIGDYKATDMGEQGYVNIGGLARERYGIENVFLLGFGTYQGQVLAGQAWDAFPEVMTVYPARAGSIEAYLHQVAGELDTSRLYLDLNGGRQWPALGRERGHRAIGVVYQSQFEAHGRNYVPTKLTGRYDAFIFADTTSALKPLESLRGKKGLFPESWPVGQ